MCMSMFFVQCETIVEDRQPSKFKVLQKVFHQDMVVYQLFFLSNRYLMEVIVGRRKTMSSAHASSLPCVPLKVQRQ
jgi:hypothetical protein